MKQLSYNELLAVLARNAVAFQDGKSATAAIEAVARIAELGKGLRAAAKRDGWDV